MKIGVLALQGGFQEHISALRKLDVDVCEIRTLRDFIAGIDGIILPGGESTTISRLLHETGLFRPLKEHIDQGLPVFGTCAGMILLASEIQDDPVSHLDCIPITVKRNAYGRQLGSFYTHARFEGIGQIPMTFIRAPYIASFKDEVHILAEVNGIQVAAESKKILVTSFHPELTDDLRVHQYFLNKITA
ncbi:MAG: pyridoxal 5'-phosphate synthase glutaminase subunit PdxT [Clostridiales bacterium]|nr:pyridoxal 5'-phosphate synthase glutaminase subunit PdxT [Clostridiales bacterium]